MAVTAGDAEVWPAAVVLAVIGAAGLMYLAVARPHHNIITSRID